MMHGHTNIKFNSKRLYKFNKRPEVSVATSWMPVMMER